MPCVGEDSREAESEPARIAERWRFVMSEASTADTVAVDTVAEFANSAAQRPSSYAASSSLAVDVVAVVAIVETVNSLSNSIAEPRRAAVAERIR